MCISEFGMKHKEFLFGFSMEQILLLIDRRVERNNRAGKQDGGTPKSRTHPDAIPGSMADAFALKKLMR